MAVVMGFVVGHVHRRWRAVAHADAAAATEAPGFGVGCVEGEGAGQGKEGKQATRGCSGHGRMDMKAG